MVAPPATHTTSHNSYGFRGSHLAWGFSIFQPATSCSPPSAKKKKQGGEQVRWHGAKALVHVAVFWGVWFAIPIFSIGIPIYKAIMSLSLCTNQRNGMSSYIRVLNLAQEGALIDGRVEKKEEISHHRLIAWFLGGPNTEPQFRWPWMSRPRQARIPPLDVRWLRQECD